MMRLQNIILLFSAVLLLNGCSVGQMVKNSYQGSRYLETQDYSQGELTFRKAVAEEPDDPLANYYLGRFILAQDKPKQSLPYLGKAASLAPKNTDYLFWQGVAQGKAGKSKMERKTYQKVLAINEDHVPARTFLGHNQFLAKEYKAALATYNKVLEIAPNNRSALYNRAMLARHLKYTSEEKDSWLAYLWRYSTGDFAVKATEYLNQLGDFSYQNQNLGGQRTTLPKIRFTPLSDEIASGSLNTLNLIGDTATNLKKGKLQIVVFQQNNKNLAKTRALSIRKYLLDNHSALSPTRVGVSWFGVPEKLVILGKKQKNPDSVRFFFTGLEKGIQSKK
jgi:tetratricopeptide (TPR) repeat protein